MFKNYSKGEKTSIFDGLWYAITTGSAEYYLSAFAIFLNATPNQISILAGLPLFVGAFSQNLSVKISESIRNRRLIMCTGSLIQACSFLAVTLLACLNHFYPAVQSGVNYPVFCLIILSTIAVAGNGLSAPMWNSLIGDIVAADKRSRFLGMRSRYIAVITLITIILMGLLLEAGKRLSFLTLAFCLIFLLGSASRFVSAYYLANYENPEYKLHRRDYFSFFSFVKNLPRSNFTKFVFFIGFMNFAVNIAGPFYSIYMLKDLGFSYLEFTIIISTTFVTQFITLESWGSLVHKYGAKKILNICSLGLVGSPFFWLVSDNFYFLLVIQFYSGLFWAGFSLSSSNFLFDAVTPPKRARCAAYQALITAFFVFTGSLFGSLIYNLDVSGLPSSFNLYATPSLTSRTFLVSGLFRLGVFLFMIRLFREVRDVEKANHRDILFNILHIRPVSGMTVTPVEDD